MAWLACDRDGSEYIYEERPDRADTRWSIWCRPFTGEIMNHVELPKGSIKKLIGRELKWEDEPVELKEESV